MKDILHALRTTGLAILDPLGAAQIKETTDWFTTRRVHPNAHVPQSARNEGRPDTVEWGAALNSECVCVPTEDAIIAPHIFERAIDLTDVVAEYLGRDPPVCYSSNAYWTRAGSSALRPDIQDFHCDTDDVRFLAMFVYLTDVTDDASGPHLLEGPDGDIRRVYGNAGTVFLADTSRRHYGMKPVVGVRGIAWFRWGVSDRPEANRWDCIEPIDAALLGHRYPVDPWLRESMRLLVTPP